ncbi:uncharacterized protein LOC124899653 [Capsicum annuum]|uniref:uncharacterized protein LOC124899653 n=1 Tax=Capsicum annuum TaxID=4072 RepID=UPI001FB12755|nr:uncharacterized protein LOC124899653 [Capsicum annuum]
MNKVHVTLAPAVDSEANKKKKKIPSVVPQGGSREGRVHADRTLNSDKDGKTSVVVTALEGVISVNSLFSVAIFVGLVFATPGQKSITSKNHCQPGVLTVKQLVIFEVLAFSFFLFSSLVAQAIKLSLYLLNTEGLPDSFRAFVNGKVLRRGMLMTAISSFMGCLFLMVSMKNVIEIKTGMIFCGAKSTIISVNFLIVMVSSGIFYYLSAAWYTFTKTNLPYENRTVTTV